MVTSQFCHSCVYLEHVSFWGDRHDYWNYLSSNVASMKQLNDVVKKVQLLTQVRSQMIIVITQL